MDDKCKAALMRWRSATINNMKTVVHFGLACISLDKDGYVHKSKATMTDEDYHQLFCLQQQYHAFAGRATRDRTPKRTGLYAEGQGQCKRIPVRTRFAWLTITYANLYRMVWWCRLQRSRSRTPSRLPSRTPSRTPIMSRSPHKRSAHSNSLSKSTPILEDVEKVGNVLKPLSTPLHKKKCACGFPPHQVLFTCELTSWYTVSAEFRWYWKCCCARAW